jgi:uncharacterized protein (DUF433 family)
VSFLGVEAVDTGKDFGSLASQFFQSYTCIMSIAFPGIDVHDNRAGQPRAYLTGTRVRVLDIYAMSELQGRSPDDIVAAMPHLNLGQVHTALAYYFDHRDQVVAQFNEEHALARAARSAMGPGPLELKLRERSAGDDAIPF